MHLIPGYSLRGELATTNDPAPVITICYHDVDPSGNVDSYGIAQPTLADAEAELLATPTDNKARVIDSIDIYNADNAAATVTLYVQDGTTSKEIAEITFATLETANWTPGSGWRTLEVDGGLKQQVA